MNLGDISADFTKVQDLLKGVQFPITKDELVTLAQERGVPSMIIDAVRGSDKETFNNPQQVQSEVLSNTSG